MHPKVLSREAWSLIRRLVEAETLDGWTLAGGTGLALQLGHRISEDLDFFRPDPFDPELLLADLATAGEVAVQSRSERTLHVVIEGVRLSFLHAQAQLLFPGTAYRGLVLADVRDIAVMKLVAIGGRGSRKDFVDLYVHLKAMSGGLEELFALLRRRFAGIDYNEYHLQKSLVFFDDAESEPMPRMLEELSWESVKEFLVDEVLSLAL